MSQNNETEIKSLADFEFSPGWEEKEVEYKNKQKPLSKGYRKKKSTIRPTLVFKAVIGNSLLENIKKILRKDGVTRNLANITKDITEKRLYNLKIEFIDNRKGFMVLNSNNRVYSKVNDLMNGLILSEKINLISEEKFSIEKEFDHVLIEEVTGNIFPPKSHNLFNNLIDVHILQNKISTDRNYFIEKLKTNRDKDVISKLKEKTFRLCKIQLENDKTFDSFESLKSVIIENKKSKYYTVQQRVSIASKEIYGRKDLSEVKGEFEKFYSRKVHKDINNCLKVISKQLNFYSHNYNKESYICAYHPKKFDKDKVNETSNKLIQHIRKGSANIGDLISQSENWKLAKTDCLKEIKWLVKSGVLRQYESGKIELT